MDGYQALREQAASIDLNARGRIFVRGEDRARLLHAMSTNHIQGLKPGEGVYAFFLNAQGRILADAYVLCFDDHILLDTEPELHDVLYQHLDKYIIADDVALEDARAVLSVIGVEGPASSDVLGAAQVSLPATNYGFAVTGTAAVAKISSTGNTGYRVFLPAGDREAFLATLNLPQASAEAQRVVRLENHQPRYGEDITDRYLLNETQQLHAAHFSKGCYLGQEIVERVRSRGQVHRLLTPLVIATDQPLPAGTLLMAGEAKAGELTSSAYSPALGKVVALAYVRGEHTKPATRLKAGEWEAEVA